MSPCLEINLKKIEHNAKSLVNFFAQQNVSIMGVTKVVLGEPKIARALIKGGIKYIADSRIENIKKMKKNNINAQFVLIRVPSISEIPLVVQFADYSLNSELRIIKMLSEEAFKQKKVHKIILMIDMGDLREGINLSRIDYYVEKILKLKNIQLDGIGTNWKCFRGIIPTEENMNYFSEIVKRIKNKFGINFTFVSGGNSANYNWFKSCKDIDIGELNNLRIGEAIFLGQETINYSLIPNLFNDAFRLTAEIVEIKERVTQPQGIAVSNAFGEIIKPSFHTKSKKYTPKKVRKQALLNIGRQDIALNGLKPKEDIKILGASSDYLVIDILDNAFQIGQKLSFSLNYEALLRTMTGPFINKKYV